MKKSRTLERKESYRPPKRAKVMESQDRAGELCVCVCVCVCGVYVCVCGWVGGCGCEKERVCV
jgi:hypothetical protein